MTKVALIADVHLGFGNRQRDILWCLRTVRQYCQDHNIDVVIVLGDFFHDRSHLSIEVLCEAYEFLKETKETYKQQWIAFPGNHDMFLKHSWQITSIRPLSEVLTIIDTVKILMVENQRYWILPFVYSEAAYMRILWHIEGEYREGDILLTHIGASNAVRNICFLLQKWTVINLESSRFRRIYAGHFHLQQQVADNMWYVGSLIPFKHDEGDSDHGFIVYDQDTQTHEFIDVRVAGAEIYPDTPVPPQYCTFHDDLLNEKTEDDVRGNLIRVATTREYTPNECKEIRDRLMNMGAARVTFINLVKEPILATPTQVGEPVKIEELFPNWFDQDTKGTVDLKRNLAIRLNHEIMQEGNEIYATRHNDQT